MKHLARILGSGAGLCAALLASCSSGQADLKSSAGPVTAKEAGMKLKKASFAAG
jgi:hypothetical protein